MKKPAKGKDNMKINFINHSKSNILSEYTNINPYGEDEDTVFGIPNDINHIVEDAEATHIIVDNILEYFSPQDAIGVIQHLISKLAHNGKITICGKELYEICRKFIDGNATLVDTVNELYNDKKCCFTCIGMINFLEEQNLEITKKAIQDTEYIVEAIRP